MLMIETGSDPMKVSATEFQQNVGRYQDTAQREPVTITKNGRPHTVLVSAAFFELATKGRIVRRVEDLDDDTLKAIAEAEVPESYADLDAALKTG
jgi:prevent-host-death family protein